MQILVAVLKLGDLTRYISESVILGFMSRGRFPDRHEPGGQPAAAGRPGHRPPAHPRSSLAHRHQRRIDQPPRRDHQRGHGAPGARLADLTRRYRLPRLDMLAALIVVALLAPALGWSHADAHGNSVVAVVGDVPAGLPAPHVPVFPWPWVPHMAASAVAIACLGLLEALAISKSIANRTREPLDYNRQCLAEGLANLGGGFFQCLPGSGSLTRSAINFQAGAVSRWSGVFAAAAVALVVVLLRPLGPLHPQPGPGRNPAGDRRRADRLAAAPLRPAGLALRRLAGAGYRAGGRLYQR